MLYFDHCSTTFPNDIVIKNFSTAAKNYPGNPNSNNRLGILCKARLDDATRHIANILKVSEESIIYTSSASEANNLAIKGLCLANRGKHIITTNLEHPSVIDSIKFLKLSGYEVSIVKLNEDGTVDMDDLKSLIREDTVLVSICYADSELGIRQNVEQIGMMLKSYPNCYFHVDASQIIGKERFDFSCVDLATFTAHKFNGIKGIGCLIKKNKVKITPLITGGNLTSRYRGGMPPVELIVSLESALELAYSDFDIKKEYVNRLSNELKVFLTAYNDIKINSTSKSISNIINISIDNADRMIELLNECGVYVSKKCASSMDEVSRCVLALYKDEKRAANTIRISISDLTTAKDVKNFKRAFDACYAKLNETQNV